ncbi:alpha/beta hydrolase [Rubrivivax sp. JA1024]|nr:alpha/beta hydrolase [Rubrivivax sp. JA1024]
MREGTSFSELPFDGRRVCIEWREIGRHAPPGTPWMVFLHEGLGSAAAWRDFPDRLCTALGWRGLVYSRPGYGRSTPRAPGERWNADYLHRQARELLPALLAERGLDTAREQFWLFGHSDGATIALLHAAAFPGVAAGAVIVAPHLWVEDLTLAGLRAARRAYVEGDLRTRLARWHDDPDSAFWGWNGVWLDERFHGWSIVDEVAAIRCPLLAVQGERDDYGTLEQIRSVARQVPGTVLLELEDCGHVPHRERPRELIAAVARFVKPD